MNEIRIWIFPRMGHIEEALLLDLNLLFFSILTNHFFREINVDSCYHKFCYTSIEQTRYHHLIKDINITYPRMNSFLGESIS